MRLRPKFGILLFVVFSVLAMVISILEANWINLLVIDHTAQQMKQNIKTGWQILHDRIAQLERSIEFLSEKSELQQGDALSPASVEPLLTRYESQWKLDVLQIATPETLLSAGIHLDYTSRAAGNPIQSGFAIVSESAFGFAPVPPIENNHTMILYAAVLLPAAPEPSAVLFCAVNLKGAFTLVDTIQAAIFEDLYYQGKRVGTVTIFMGVERIATTVLKQTGERAVGTLVSDEVAEQTLKQGVPWTGRAWVVNNWYLSQYDPIRDAKGKVIGMLYIGELEQVYLDMKWNTLWKSVLVVFVVMALAMLVSYKVSARVLQQIEALDQATLRFAKGDLSTRAEITTQDEIGELAASFNAMAETLEGTQKQLLQQKEEIERVNSNYMEMLGFATHELRSTVSSALFNVGLLKDGSYGELSGDQLEGVEHVENSLLYLAELTNNYLQLSRIEKGELIINKTSVRLKTDIIASVLRGLNQLIKSRSMRIVDLIPDSFSIPADMNLLRVVYENLIGNAAKFGQEGGQIELDAYFTEEKTVCLTVRNQGRTIASERLPMLFKKFERYDVDERTGKQGSGLGLFIVQQIVKVHGGEIQVVSGEEEGTCFQITLPC